MRRALLLALLALAAPARAADITDVASSFQEGNKFDFRFRVRYDHMEKRAQLKREIQGLSTQQSTEVFKDLSYREYRDSLSLRAEAGLYRNLMLYLELPVIIEQAASYAFDQSAGGSCVFPPAANPNCVNASNSSTVADGIVPQAGYDARQNGVPPPSGLFRTVMRGARGGSGLDAFDTINLGLTWAPFNQARDPTKPTWTITAEGQISFGNIMAFDRAAPDANHAVSEGLHRLVVRTAVSKRYRWFEPYWSLWYTLQIPRDGSLFVDYGRNQKTKSPQMLGGVTFGSEVVPFERPAKQYRLALDARMRVLGHFSGRGYSEAWQLLAGAPPLACDGAQAPFNPACDPTQPANPYSGKPFTGITTIENYASVGADVAVMAQVGPFFRLRTGFEYQHDQPHFITGDDIGSPSTASGRVTLASEFNPAYRPVVDLVGRRYLVDSVNVYNFYLWAQVMF